MNRPWMWASLAALPLIASVSLAGSTTFRIDECIGGVCRNGLLHTVTVTDEQFIVVINPDRCERRFYCPTRYDSFNVEGDVPVRVEGYEPGTNSVDMFTVYVPRRYKALYLHGIGKQDRFATIDLTPFEAEAEGRDPAAGVDSIVPALELAGLAIDQSVLRTAESTLQVEGRVTDNVGVAQLAVNGRSVKPRDDGRFAATVELEPGSNLVTIVAADAAGNETTREIEVLREAAPPAPGLAASGRRGVAVVFGVERYRYAPPASHARNDAELLAALLDGNPAFGRESVLLRVDEQATLGELAMAFAEDGWLAQRVDAQTDVLVYFAGHGVRLRASGEPVLLPQDVDPRYPAAGLSLRELLQALGRLPSAAITVVLDATFAGRDREGEPLIEGESVSRLAQAVDLVPPPNAMLLLAASEGEDNGTLPEERHGLFTAELLRGLTGGADGDGDRRITGGELADYLARTVSGVAAREGREQHPRRLGSDASVVLAY